MKLKNTKRLTFTLSTLCLASTLFCSVNAQTSLKKGCYDASVRYPLGDKMTMVGKPMVCTYAVLPNGKTGYRWEPMHSKVHKVALNKPIQANAALLVAGTRVGATLDAHNNVSFAVHPFSKQDVRLVKSVMQHSPLYEFNLGMQTVSPKLSHVLNNTLAYYQRQRTNILLSEIVANQHEAATKTNIPFSTGKNALLLHIHDETIPFFQFVHDFHAQAYVQQCVIPLARRGDVTLYQLHRAWNMLTILGNVNINNKLYRLHHCKSRTLKLNDRLHHAHLRSWHEAALLAAANHAVANHHNRIGEAPANAILLARLRDAWAVALLHPAHKNIGAYLKLWHRIEEANAAPNSGIQKTSTDVNAIEDTALSDAVDPVVQDRLLHGLPSAISTQVHYWDPTVTLKIKGKATRINPVEQTHFNKKVVYFNGNNVWQVAFARALLKHSSLPVILIATQGNTKSLMRMLHAPVSIAHQHGIEKLHITSVPTVVTVGSGRYANHLVLTTVKLPYHLLNQKVYAFSSDNVKSKAAALSASKAWGKVKHPSFSAGGGGITIAPGSFNFISDKQFEKELNAIGKDMAHEAATTQAKKTIALATNPEPKTTTNNTKPHNVWLAKIQQLKGEHDAH